jgi:hypothetical protein
VNTESSLGGCRDLLSGVGLLGRRRRRKSRRRVKAIAAAGAALAASRLAPGGLPHASHDDGDTALAPVELMRLVAEAERGGGELRGVLVLSVVTHAPAAAALRGVHGHPHR